MTLVPHPTYDILRPSPREYRVLQELLKDGADNLTIAIRLGVTLDTVKCHIRNLLRKAGLNNRTELAVNILQDYLRVKIPAGGE